MHGPDGVHPKRRQAYRRGRPPAVPVQTERRGDRLCVGVADLRAAVVSSLDQLAREGVRIAPVTIWRLLRRRHVGTRRARVAVLEHGRCDEGLLTERTAKPIRHVEADQPGDVLLSLDTFYVGNLKGVGKVWPITGCDVASSFGWARLIFDARVTAAAVLRLLFAGDGSDRPTCSTPGWRRCAASKSHSTTAKN